ncbi:putative inorganic phosphate cotransporter [Fragariocoptes setiger]|uniref:Inorganic phosphate cotransporter n=1 Tax=Fragariocoptes setiger TaxID=1670756 RepID=A0ABQ7SAB0_9ACAR|nr:putative inorganic phosphate cotransporter [Fragariocoptes setiger]
MKLPYMRFVIVALTTAAAFAVYVSRINLGIAIIAMVDDEFLKSGGDHSPAPAKPMLSNMSSSIQGLGPTPTGTRLNTPPGSQHDYYQQNRPSSPFVKKYRFQWTQVDQGTIIGAFFYGYLLLQIPGARIAEKIGVRSIIMVSLIGSTLISFLFPIATQLESIPLLWFLRFIQGLCQSAFFPAGYFLFCCWLPEKERSVAYSVLFIGSNLGSITTYFISGLLINSSWGWPLMFYAPGLVCLFMTIMVFLLVANEPRTSKLIDQNELKYIRDRMIKDDLEHNKHKFKFIDSEQPDEMDAQRQQSLHQQINDTKPDVSWKKLLTNAPVWILVMAQYGTEYSNAVSWYEVPSYLNYALNFPISQNGVISGFLQVADVVSSPIMGTLGMYVLHKHFCGMQKIHVRKLFQSVALFGQLLCFIGIPLCGENRNYIVVLMITAVVFRAFSNAGDVLVPSDLSTNYSGTIFAFANTVGNTAGILAPALVGILVKDPHVREQWTPFWLITAAIMAFSGIVFLLFGVVSRQDLDREIKVIKLGSVTNLASPDSGEAKSLQSPESNSLLDGPQKLDNNSTPIRVTTL